MSNTKKILRKYCLGGGLLWLMICCGAYESPEMLEHQNRIESFSKVTGYNLLQPSEKYLLPDVLSEVSGLSFYKKNVLACVQDELGTVFLYDLKNKSIFKRLKFARNGDFEGLAVVDKSIFIAKSNGDLFHYQEVQDTTIKIETPLSASNDVEGLAYDHSQKRLLIACKESPALKGHKKEGKALFSYYLSGNFNPAPAYIIKEEQIKAWNKSQGTPLELTKKMRGFKPSGVAVHPKSNDIYVVAYAGRVLIVISQEGAVKHFVPLPAKTFRQPEGICFAPNGDLYISNESKDGMANILKFSWKK